MSFLTPIISSLLRSAFIWIGGNTLAKQHDSDIVILAGIIVSVLPAIWGALSAKFKTSKIEDLKEDKVALTEKLESARSETEHIKKLVSGDPQLLK